MSLWNVKNLESPPITTYKTNNRDVDILKLKVIFKDALDGLKSQGLILDPEAAYISRWIYRMKTKLRSDKGLKCVEKINRALLQLLRINFNQTLKTFQNMIPKRYSHVNYMPTLNNLHFVLVRIQGVAKLMVRVIESCRSAAEFFHDRIERGHFWNISLICFAAIARIFKTVKEYIKILCQLYDQLVPFTKVLKNIKFNWLPIDYELPSNLHEWLNADELLKEIEEPKLKVAVPRIFDLSIAEVDMEFNENDDITEESTKTRPEQNRSRVIENKHIQDLMSTVNANSISDEDIGEAIETKPRNKKLKQAKIINPINLINNIQSLHDLTKFQNDVKHNNLRSFKNVDKVKCRILQNKLNKMIKTGKKNRNNVSHLLEEAREIIKSLLL